MSGSLRKTPGSTSARKWQDQSGVDRYTTEVVLRPYSGSLVLLDRRENGTAGGSDYGYQAPASGAPAGGGRKRDDEIPFAPEWR